MSRESLHTGPARTPYGARVSFVLVDDVDFGLSEEFTLFEDDSSVVRVRQVSHLPRTQSRVAFA